MYKDYKHLEPWYLDPAAAKPSKVSDTLELSRWQEAEFQRYALEVGDLAASAVTRLKALVRKYIGFHWKRHNISSRSSSIAPIFLLFGCMTSLASPLTTALAG